MKTSQETVSYLQNHAYLKKSFSKLTSSEVNTLTEFFNQNLTKNEMAEKANRFFMDQPNKTKNWKIISEMLSGGITFKFS